MLHALFVLLPLALSWFAIRRFLPGLPKLVTAGMVALVPIVVLSWLTLVLSSVIRTNQAVLMVNLLILGSCIFILWKYPPQFAQIKIFQLLSTHLRKILESWWLWLSVLALLLLFLNLLVTHSVQEKNGNWYTGGSTWGDIALHLSYINNFTRQTQLSLTSPIYAQAQTSYPFLFDWYTSILIRQGFTVQSALIGSQWQAFLAIVLLSVSVLRVLVKRKSAVLITLGLFFAGGGFGWWYFWGDWLASGLPLTAFLADQPWQFTNMAARSVFFSSVIPDMLLPQRGFVMGLTVVLIVMNLLLQYRHKKSSSLLYVSATLIGLLPFFHIHSFLWLSGLWFVHSLYLWLKQPKQRQALLRSCGVLLLLALPQIWWFFNQGVSDHFIAWHPGWMLDWTQSTSLFASIKLFLLNFGITAGILTVVPLRIKKMWITNPTLALFIGYSWLVFVVCLFVSFQPWPYDNLKFMMLSYFFFCVFAALELAQWWVGWKKVLVICIVLSGTLSGTLSLIREVLLNSVIADAQERTIAGDLQTILKPGAVVLTGYDHNHPVPMLIGQPVVMGYPGWLWSHGIDSSQTLSDVSQLYAGTDLTNFLLSKHEIGYVYISNRERSKFTVNETYWSEHFTKLYEKGDVVVYQVNVTQN